MYNASELDGVKIAGRQTEKIFLTLGEDVKKTLRNLSDAHKVIFEFELSWSKFYRVMIRDDRGRLLIYAPNQELEKAIRSALRGLDRQLERRGMPG